MLSDEHRAELTTAVERLAWATLDLDPGTKGESQERWLAVLTALLAIRDDAEQLAGSAALSAAQHGADYPAIGLAAGMTRQGARRKWPGLAGLSESRQRKRGWWDIWGSQFVECVRAVVALPEVQDLPWLANLRVRLAGLDETSPHGAFELMLVDAYSVALNAPTPADPADARLLGLLSALTAEAYAATNGHSDLIPRASKLCATTDCGAESIIELLRQHAGFPAVPACRPHALEVLREPAARVVTAYQPDVAVSLFVEARG